MDDNCLYIISSIYFDVQVTDEDTTFMSLQQSLIKLEGWESLVTIVSSDMRNWDAPEKADILVLFLLWS